MNINLFLEDIEVPGLDSEFFVSWLAKCENSVFESALGDVNIIVCSDDFLLKMNREHLNHDYYTDIITFDYSNEEISGELFISWDRVSENAKTNNVSRETEFNRVVAHGCLHLDGYGDKTDEESKVMREMEEKCLALL